MEASDVKISTCIPRKSIRRREVKFRSQSIFILIKLNVHMETCMGDKNPEIQHKGQKLKYIVALPTLNLKGLKITCSSRLILQSACISDSNLWSKQGHGHFWGPKIQSRRVKPLKSARSARGENKNEINQMNH